MFGSTLQTNRAIAQRVGTTGQSLLAAPAPLTATSLLPPTAGTATPTTAGPTPPPVFPGVLALKARMAGLQQRKKASTIVTGQTRYGINPPAVTEPRTLGGY